MAQFTLLLFVSLIFIYHTFAAQYFVDSHLNCNNVWGAIDDADTSSQFVRFLGIFKTIEECTKACVDNSTSTDQCFSYTYHTSKYAEPYTNHCYGRFGQQYGSLWTPYSQKDINCGRIIWKCTSNLDCELNGQCNTNTGNCTCRTGWTGYKCQNVNVLPATTGTGYHITNDNGSGHPTSSWGGAVLQDPNDKNDNTKYHMYLAEFDNHCGVVSWALNSVVTHAQSTKAAIINNATFERVSVLHQHFAHEPDAVFGPNGEIVLYYAAYNWSSKYPECQCTDGSTGPCNMPGGHFINIMDISTQPYAFNGPWKRNILFPTWTLDKDTTLAGVILKNGSFVGLMKDYHPEDDLTCWMHRVSSSDYTDASKYVIHEANTRLFPQLVTGGTEDPFVYRDCDGGYHAMFHNMSPQDDQPYCGGHAYSIDGVEWIYAGVSFSNTVEFADGTTFTFPRRERPHFIMNDDGCTPIALTSGVDYGGKYGDATYTLLQPIAHPILMQKVRKQAAQYVLNQ